MARNFISSPQRLPDVNRKVRWLLVNRFYVMSPPIHVDEYSGHTANQRPRSFTLGEELYEVAAVLDQWYEPSATYFKVQTTAGKVYLLRYAGQTDEWTLQSGFDADELLQMPGLELVTVGPEALRRAENVGRFTTGQKRFLEFHRDMVLLKAARQD